MARRILIVDDSSINRTLLRGLLSREYDIEEAADGAQAMQVIHRTYKSLSAVLLDVAMPVMDGYEVLRAMRSNAVLAQIPVIIITNSNDEETRIRALALGANDFIAKPYNPEIIKHCLHNNVMLRETASIVNAIQRDRLTGLYNREIFFEKASDMIKSRPAGYYVLTCLDIDNFKLVNDQLGAAEGDRILNAIGGRLKTLFNEVDGLCGRISGDNFAGLFPDTPEVHERVDAVSLWALPTDATVPLHFSEGRYIVNDPELPVSAIYDRAYIAKQSIKGRYDTDTAYFSQSMLESLLHEQRIIGQMHKALDGHQFEVWFQPQYNHATGGLVGAEALVRWRHPETGLIPPNDFIPVFERNGFVYALDKYVWTRTCALLRRWLDEGRDLPPVSVNISRYDIFRADFIEFICSLVERYDIPVDLLRLEITESAFAESAERIVGVVRQLIDYGFTVEIDDFGSGYSSLNTLKNVPAQVLKLDMRFLEDDDGSRRGGNILESVVRMAKWLGMSVIAEGVETSAQADYLKSIGCSCVQGWLYSRALPADEFIALCGASVRGREEPVASVNLAGNAFWDPESLDTLIFNCYVGGAGIFEYNNGKIEMMRVNDRFARSIGGDTCTSEYALSMDWDEHMSPETSRALYAAIDRAVDSGDEAELEAPYYGLPGAQGDTWLRTTFRLITRTGTRSLVYAAHQNITRQRVAEAKERAAEQERARAYERLEAIVSHINGGVTATYLDADGAHLLFRNETYLKQLGYTSEQYDKEVKSFSDLIHPDDRGRVLKAVREAGHESYSVSFRVIRRDGEIRWLQSNVAITEYAGVDGPVQLAVTGDVTDRVMIDQQRRELVENLPCGAAVYELRDGEIHVVYLNRRYHEILGRDTGDLSTTAVFEVVHPDDVKSTLAALGRATTEKGPAECDIRILNGQGGYTPFHLTGIAADAADGAKMIYATYTPMTEQELSFREVLPAALETMLAAQTEYTFVKDRNLNYVFCSRAFARMAGLEDERSITGMTDVALFGAEFAEVYSESDRRVLERGELLVDYIETAPGTDGTRRYINLSKYPLLAPNGDVVGVYGSGRDVTLLREETSRLRLLTDSIPGGIATYRYENGKASILYFNDGLCRLFGTDREGYIRLCGDNVLYGVFEEDAARVRAALGALVSDDEPMDFTCRVRTAAGQTKWLNICTAVSARPDNAVIFSAVIFDITEQQNAVERLRISEEENRLALRHSNITIGRFNVADGSLRLPAREYAEFSLPERIENVPGGPVEAGDISPETTGAYTALFDGIRRGSKGGEAVYQRRGRGGWRWLKARYTTVFSESGEPTSAVISFVDITRQMEKEAAFRRWRQALHAMRNEDYALVRCNISRNTPPVLTEGALLSVVEGATLDLSSAAYARDCLHPADKDAYTAFLRSDSLLAGYRCGQPSGSLDYRELMPDGGERWLRLTVDLIELPNATDVEAYMLYENIDAAKRAELLTRERAETDPLTGVLNRAAFIERIGGQLARAANGGTHALLMLDLDGFKQVNDVFGHATGDEALVGVAGLLRAALRHGDLLGRLGGDEFVIFLSDIPGEDAAVAKARTICSLVRRRFSEQVAISGSIGVALAPRDGMSFDVLYRHADKALYRVKSGGRDSFAVYRP